MSDLISLVQLSGIGSHVKKEHLLEALLNSSSETPFQIFYSAKVGSKAGVPPKDFDKIKELLKVRQVFIHAPYTVNLCKVFEDNWHLKLLLTELTIGRKNNFRGVVVHTGKYCDMGKSEGYQQMVKNLILVENVYADHAVEEKDNSTLCPLLIETPAGQGTELCCSSEELQQLLLEVRSKSRNPQNVKICVDTCHIFAVGFEPIEYILTFPPSDIGLIHFNGSACPQGSKKDRHAFTNSYLTEESLMQVYLYAISNNIPMVTE